MSGPRVLVLGTTNRKKGLELAELVRPLGVEVRTLADFADVLSVVEDGATFGDNARLKATQQGRHLGHWTLGEDSGLSVDALDGAPGIYSARYAGTEASDAENNRRLLTALAGVPRERRTAHYVCHATLADPQGVVRAESEAECRGRIVDSERGQAGFGYDPLFEIPEYHRTFGELGPSVKRSLSHRSRAMRMLLPQLAALLD